MLMLNRTEIFDKLSDNPQNGVTARVVFRSAHSVCFTEDMTSLPFTSSCLLWLQVCYRFSSGAQTDWILLRGDEVKYTDKWKFNVEIEEPMFCNVLGPSNTQWR